MAWRGVFLVFSTGPRRIQHSTGVTTSRPRGPNLRASCRSRLQFQTPRHSRANPIHVNHYGIGLTTATAGGPRSPVSLFGVHSRLSPSAPLSRPVGRERPHGASSVGASPAHRHYSHSPAVAEGLPQAANHRPERRGAILRLHLPPRLLRVPTLRAPIEPAEAVPDVRHPARNPPARSRGATRRSAARDLGPAVGHPLAGLHRRQPHLSLQRGLFAAVLSGAPHRRQPVRRPPAGPVGQGADGGAGFVDGLRRVHRVRRGSFRGAHPAVRARPLLPPQRPGRGVFRREDCGTHRQHQEHSLRQDVGRHCPPRPQERRVHGARTRPAHGPPLL